MLCECTGSRLCSAERNQGSSPAVITTQLREVMGAMDLACEHAN